MGRRLASLLLLVATACGASSEDGQSATTGGTAEQAEEARVSVLPATSAPTTTAVPSRFEFVDYTVSGGIAGVTDHLKVYPDGRATYDDGTRVVHFTVTPETVAQLKAALESAGVASLPSQVQTVRGADRFTYRVIYGGRAVRFTDGTVPPSLRPALAILDRELATGKGMR
jgi:hypothetical protein